MNISKGMKVHFIGIGGIGMSAAANLALERGIVVSGCDLQRNRFTAELEERGCMIDYRHDPAHLESIDLVVTSSAISREMQETAEARRMSIPVYKRAIFTLLLMSDRKLIGIAGSHGKTTTTWMTAHSCIEAGLDPSMMVGGTIPGVYGNFRIGPGEWFISEVDESDGTITEVKPRIAVLTNVDREHLTYYGGYEPLRDAFAVFCANTDPDGVLIVCGEDSDAVQLAQQAERRMLTYGWGSQFDIHVSDVDRRELHTSFTLHYKGETFGNIRLLFSGEHNILNSLAAFGAAVSAGIDPAAVIRALESCRPVARRFELAGSMDDVLLVNDYAHHPTEINAVMETVEFHLSDFRKIYIFQPHRYSRLKDSWSDFLTTLESTNILIVLPVYSANEEPIEGVSSQKLVEELNQRGVHAELLKKNLISAHLDTIVQKGDCVIFLGAGDIGDIYNECARRFGR